MTITASNVSNCSFCLYFSTRGAPRFWRRSGKTLAHFAHQNPWAIRFFFCSWTCFGYYLGTFWSCWIHSCLMCHNVAHALWLSIDGISNLLSTTVIHNNIQNILMLSKAKKHFSLILSMAVFVCFYTAKLCKTKNSRSCTVRFF